MHPSTTDNPKRGPSFCIWMVLIPLVCTSCMSGRENENTEGDEPDPNSVDQPDNTDTGHIVLSEQDLSAEVQDDKLEISIPIKTNLRAASGELKVAIQKVNGKETLATTSVDYDLDANSDRLIKAELDIPEQVVQQPDWVQYNLLITNRDDKPLKVTKSLLLAVKAYEIHLEGPANLKQEKQAVYRVRAQSPIDQQPIAGVDVELMISKDDTEIKTLSLQTDDRGDAVFEVALDEPGEYQVKAQGASQGTIVEIGDGIDVVEPGQKLLLTTDKPMYQPGQTMHLRALALVNPENTPLKKQPLLFEIEDGKGNKIFKKEIKTDNYGIASTTFRLANILNMGTFAIRVLNGETYQTQKTVEVYRYALPKFDAQITMDRDWYSPNGTVSGTLQGRYFFGKPVVDSTVNIEICALDIGESCFDQYIGRTDDEGEMDFSLQLPSTLAGIPLENGNAIAFLRAKVTDTAGQEVQKESSLVVAQSAVDLSLVPESTAVIPGIENRLHLFATDPLGVPYADASVGATSSTGQTLEATTDAFGHAVLSWTPEESSNQTFQVTVNTTDGLSATQPFSFSTQAGAEHLLLRTDKSVYELGEVVKVEVITSVANSFVYVDWLNQGQAVDMQTLQSENGKASFTKTLDTTLLGSNRIEAYVVDDQGNIVRDGRTVFVRNNTALSVEFDSDKSMYAPGEEAELTFSVVDDTGDPKVAALGVQIVDEAVFALIDAHPGLLRTYFELEDAYAQPQYQIKGPRASITQLLFNDTAAEDEEQVKAAQQRAAATFAAMGPMSLSGVQKASWKEVIQKANQLLETYYESEKERLSKPVAEAVVNSLATAKKAGCDPNEYCESYNEYYTTVVLKLAQDELSAGDFWGNSYQIQFDEYPASMHFLTKGPDEVLGTDDDRTIEVLISEIESDDFWGGEMDSGIAFDDFADFDEMEQINMSTGVDQAGEGFGPPMEATSEKAEEPGQDSDQEGPRVRKDFPETLYVNPSLITDSDGKATVRVPMADSITEWRVSTLANSADGKLGGGASGITVFQDFFVDIDFPASLTRGDEIDFPIAIYNYLDSDQTVDIELTADDWFTALGDTTARVEMEPNQVMGIRFPVRVQEVGTHTLTVTAIGSELSDAVQRAVRVEPDGEQIATANSGALESGQVAHEVTFPAESIDGSEVMYLNIYPGFLSQVVEGMDSILQTPSGCFEQTTSSTWPNVLVTAYMQQVGAITPEIQMKAESLISAGYQRLLTYEHTEGGYSWFGEPGDPNISVTAFGLMEFADMSEVATVDPDMVQRTQEWLLGQQASDGSWQGEETEFFSFNSSTLRNSAFVVWALSSAGYTGSQLDSALNYIKENLDSEENDPYTLALVANGLIAADPNDATINSILSDLEEMKQTDGDKVYWDSSQTQTNFYCEGNDASVATTALVAHAMILTSGYADSIQGALQYLTSSKDPNGNFGSTQATIWALRTLLLSARRGTEGAVGEVTISVNDEVFETVQLTESSADIMITVDLSTLAAEGSHNVQLIFSGEGKVSYNLVSSYHIPWQSSPQDPQGPLSIDVAYDKTTFTLDEMVTANVTVNNHTNSVQNMVLVTVGVAPGFQVVTEDLDEYIQQGVLSKYETTGKQLTLYISLLNPNSEQLFTYRLKATMPVKASDGGATVKPYYQPDQESKKAETILEVVQN